MMLANRARTVLTRAVVRSVCKAQNLQRGPVVAPAVAQPWNGAQRSLHSIVPGVVGRPRPLCVAHEGTLVRSVVSKDGISVVGIQTRCESVLRKRKKKMNKHKHRKRLKVKRYKTKHGRGNR